MTGVTGTGLTIQNTCSIPLNRTSASSTSMFLSPAGKDGAMREELPDEEWGDVKT